MPDVFQDRGNGNLYSAGKFAFHFFMTPMTLAPGVAAQIVPHGYGVQGISHRLYLVLQVTGTGNATFKFGGAPSSALDGFCLDGASSNEGQGGSCEFRDTIPGDSVWAISAAGTTVVALEAT